MHVIRLRGFWESTPTGEGRFRHLRRFGRPRVSDPDERIRLAGVPGDVWLNGEPLGSDLDVTTLLLPRNEVVIATDDAAPPEDVRLEIGR